MPSPFPGMNPYLEQPAVWTDFHTRFIAAAADVLADALAPGYYAKIGEHLYFHEADDRERIGDADLSVHPAEFEGTGGAATTVLTEPVTVEVSDDVDITRVAFLEIFDRVGHEVVTALELLSPSNKYAGPDRDQYLGKRRQLLGSRTHLVEIDLLRGGPRMPWANVPAGAFSYSVAVSRSHRRPCVDLWPIRLRDLLPSIPIPLREGVPEPRLDLQAVLHHVYDRSGYRLYIYESEPEPRLSAPDAAWAEALIAPAPRPLSDPPSGEMT